MKNKFISSTVFALIAGIVLMSGQSVAFAKGKENDKGMGAEFAAELKAHIKDQVEKRLDDHMKKVKDRDNNGNGNGNGQGNGNNGNNGNGNGHNKPQRPATTTPDTTAPVISEIKVVRTTQKSATIEWKTNERTTSLIKFGSTTAYNLSKKDNERTTKHRLKLKKLSPNTTYHFAIVAKDRAGNTATSTDQTFTTKTKNNTDTTAPVISNVSVVVGTSTARIRWNTNESASGDIDYGTTTTYSSTFAGAAVGTSQDITLTDLSPSTLYHFKINAEDASGNTSSTSNATFTTNALPVVDTTAPNLSNILVTALGSTTATISWTTNENATGKIYYSSTSPVNVGTAASQSNALLTTAHTFVLPSLTASTTYYFILESKDGNNNAATSTQMNFTTTQ